ncbi:hypothetical protein COLO4_36439 [Corchorus olitorius]|uniref:Uncharacterized protein n=1 Tax=Corchorus olitorius TaxID=93759 RepID=A0A1R3G8V1_9ROSI|nr:hypothetical protein COLO4_36439 [Corchorus olitorius]
MAQYRQQYHYGNGTTSDHVAIGVRGGGAGAGNKAARWRRSGRADKSRRISISSLIVVLSLVLVVTVLVYYYISADNSDSEAKVKNEKEASLVSDRDLDRRGIGLYNEAGRNELKMYEARYEESLKDGGKSRKELENSHQDSDSKDLGMHDEVDDADDHYNDGTDSSETTRMEDYDDIGHDNEDNLDDAKSHDENVKESSTFFKAKPKVQHIVKEVKEESAMSREVSQDFDDVDANSQHVSSLGRKSGKSSRVDSKKKPRRRKFSA